jgi:alpha-D-ribose 1-methylphosphonate 5-triphosphate synthase subunit PhnG
MDVYTNLRLVEDPMTSRKNGHTSPEQTAEHRSRRRWLSILAKAKIADLESLFNNLPNKPEWTVIRAPETGMIMARGRAGGTGQRFNLGEVTVTRCAVRLDYGAAGHGYVMGRDRRHAELVAVVDAMMQIPSRRDALESAVIAPLAMRQADFHELAARKVASTKVDFFTMVRGD